MNKDWKNRIVFNAFYDYLIMLLLTACFLPYSKRTDTNVVDFSAVEKLANVSGIFDKTEVSTYCGNFYTAIRFKPYLNEKLSFITIDEQL